MDKKQLEKLITDYIQVNPKITDDEFLEVIKTARQNAFLSTIPEYRPLEIVDKREITAEFEEQSKELERKHYEDESTTEEFY